MQHSIRAIDVDFDTSLDEFLLELGQTEEIVSIETFQESFRVWVMQKVPEIPEPQEGQAKITENPRIGR